MSNSEELQWKNSLDLCKNLVKYAIKSVLNGEGDSEESEYWLRTSPLASLIFEECGIPIEDVGTVIDKLKEDNMTIWANSLISKERHQKRSDFLSQSRKGKKRGKRHEQAI